MPKYNWFQYGYGNYSLEQIDDVFRHLERRGEFLAHRAVNHRHIMVARVQDNIEHVYPDYVLSDISEIRKLEKRILDYAWRSFNSSHKVSATLSRVKLIRAMQELGEYARDHQAILPSAWYIAQAELQDYKLRQENADLQIRLAEAEDTIDVLERKLKSTSAAYHMMRAGEFRL
jgi:hypothetical protein